MRTLIHADVYRTESLAEVADLALAELVEEDAVALVEWGDRAAPAFDESALVITLVTPDPVGAPAARVVEIIGRGAWAVRADEVAAALEPCGRVARPDERQRTKTSWPLKRPPRRWGWPSGRQPVSKRTSPSPAVAATSRR